MPEPPDPDSPGLRGPQSGDVSVGDVVRSWQMLGARSPSERRSIAEALGFHYSAPETDSSRLETPSPEQARSDASRAPASREGANRPIDPADPASDPVEPRALPLERVETRAAPAAETWSPAWLHADVPLEAERPEHYTRRLLHQPLFTPGWTRAILSAACATRARDGSIDVDRIIDALGSCRPLRELPRHSEPSLRRGMQLLVDRAEGMMPFERDARDLAQQLLAVVGRDRTQVLYFESCPMLGCGPAGRSTWRRPYEPPAAGTPIVVLTDVGIARDSAVRSSVTEASWLGFIAVARAVGCPVVVFAPYPLDRWPHTLIRQVRAIQWDRTTTAWSAHRAARGEDERG